MPFVTYAQNFEDLMLSRALNGVESGFYIDVGANDPVAESVTKHFYDRGWSGINIEPGDIEFMRLEQLRPRDINLKVGAWSRTGDMPLFIINESAAFTTLEPAMAELHRQAGRAIRQSSITTVTLSDVCKQYVGRKVVHFLKVDVEAGELHVFQGHDFDRCRPWIIVAEAHGPDFELNLYQPWEDILIKADYSFVYTDGLNRFYIANEKMGDLSRAFTRPPNVYDEWIRPFEIELRERVEFAEKTRADAWKQLEVAQDRVRELETRLTAGRTR